MMGTDSPLAAHLPGLYRAALDAVDELARRGGRRDAARLRTAAARAYSRAWDERCRRTLEHVIRDAHAAAGTEAPSLLLEDAAAASFG
jgi:hypothetical protein